MKLRMALYVAGALMLLASSRFVAAQLDPVQRKAEIPFAFHVQDEQFPAGAYYVGWVGARLRIQSADGKRGVWVIAIPFNSEKANKRSALEFARYGDAVYLKRVLVAGRNIGHELLSTREEEQMAQQQSRQVIAKVRLEPVR